MERKSGSGQGQEPEVLESGNDSEAAGGGGGGIVLPHKQFMKGSETEHCRKPGLGNALDNG